MEPTKNFLTLEVGIRNCSQCKLLQYEARGSKKVFLNRRLKLDCLEIGFYDMVESCRLRWEAEFGKSINSVQFSKISTKEPLAHCLHP